MKTFMGMTFHEHPALPVEVAKFRFDPERKCQLSDEFRARMEAWCTEFFGTTPFFIVVQGDQVMAHPDNMQPLMEKLRRAFHNSGQFIVPSERQLMYEWKTNKAADSWRWQARRSRMRRANIVLPYQFAASGTGEPRIIFWRDYSWNRRLRAPRRMRIARAKWKQCSYRSTLRPW